MRKWIERWLDAHWAPRRVAVFEQEKHELQGTIEDYAIRVENLFTQRQREVGQLRDRLREFTAHMEGGLPPHLTPAEIERLAMLMEECGEVIQAAGKILRHGWASQSPYGGKTNRVALERELGDVRAMVNVMIDAGDVRLADVQSWQRRKRERMAMWTHHQADSMPREAYVVYAMEVRNQAAKVAAQDERS